MKICLFADAQSAHIQGLAPGLAARGHDVHVVTHKPAPVRGATVERFSVPTVNLLHPRRWQGRWTHYLRGFLRRFDVVNVHFLHDWGFRLPSEVRENARLIATAWGSDIVDPPGETPASPELVQTRVSLLRHADAVTTCGPTFAATVAEFAGIGRNAVQIVPFGVDVDLFHPSDDSTRGVKAAGRVGFFKGFREVYGPTYLIRAILLVLAGRPETRFELVGDGAQRGPCQALARELGVDASIEWIPRKRHEALPDLLGHWDVSVIPSVHEAFGVAALESSAMGLPVVASDVCGLRDTVRHGRTGLLVPPRSPQALADAILSLLNDAAWARSLGREGRAMVEREYDWNAIFDQWATLYARVREQATVMV